MYRCGCRVRVIAVEFGWQPIGSSVLEDCSDIFETGGLVCRFKRQAQGSRRPGDFVWYAGVVSAHHGGADECLSEWVRCVRFVARFSIVSPELEFAVLTSAALRPVPQ